MTIKSVAARRDGWAFLTFVESLPELANCNGRTWGSATYSSVLWIDAVSTAGRAIYSAALLAWITGKKLEGANYIQSATPGDCVVDVIRVAP